METKKVKKSRVWVLLRGLMRGSGHMGFFPDLLQKQFPHDQIILADIPGNGVRNHEVTPLSVDEIVLDLKSHYSISENSEVMIVATSFGGMVAAQWAVLFPNQVTRLVLINTSAGELSPIWDRLRPSNYWGILKTSAQPDAESVESWILKAVCNSSEARAQMLPQWVAFAKKHPGNIKNLIRQLWAASRFALPDRVPSSVLLLGSPEDRFVAYKCSEKIAQKWQCPLIAHPWAGHDIIIDDPEWVLEQIIKAGFDL